MNFDRVFGRHFEMNHEPELSSELEGTLSIYEGRSEHFLRFPKGLTTLP